MESLRNGIRFIVDTHGPDCFSTIRQRGNDVSISEDYDGIFYLIDSHEFAKEKQRFPKVVYEFRWIFVPNTNNEYLDIMSRTRDTVFGEGIWSDYLRCIVCKWVDTPQWLLDEIECAQELDPQTLCFFNFWQGIWSHSTNGSKLRGPDLERRIIPDGLLQTGVEYVKFGTPSAELVEKVRNADS